MIKYCLLLLVALILGATQATNAQSVAQLKKQAVNAYETGKFQEALALYRQLQAQQPKEADHAYALGRCHFYLQEYAAALEEFKAYAAQNAKPEEALFYYLARAEHLQANFAAASLYYKNYLKTAKLSQEERQVNKQYLLQCLTAAKVVQIQSNAIVSPMSTNINSPYDDLRACFFPSDPNQLFFSSNRKQQGLLKEQGLQEFSDFDVYQSAWNLGTWSDATALASRYNTPLSERLIGFFDEGYQMVLAKHTVDGFRAVVKENVDEDTTEVVLPYAPELHVAGWEDDHIWVHDSLLIFSSNRAGGYGGQDLYYSKRVNGVWQAAINLGAIINSPYDEISPFVASDGQSLYFSSNKLASMGGFDVYQSQFDPMKQQWRLPQNMGVPINSAADERDFLVKEDGLQAYFSSNRAGGQGGYDLYTAYFRLPQQYAKRGKTFADYLPDQAIANTTNNDNISNNNSNSNNTTSNQAPTKDETVYTISPIYYNAATGQTEGARNTFLALKKLLTKHPDVSIILSAHTNNIGNPINDLYLSVKQAELFAQDLIKQGVAPNQITAQGCAQQYPVAKHENFDGSPNEIGSKMNQRIEIDLNIPVENPVSVQNISPLVSPMLQDLSYANYQIVSSGLRYRIQLVKTSSFFQHPIFAEAKHVLTEKAPNEPEIAYCVYLLENFEQAKASLKQLQTKGFQQAQIIPYIDGKRLSGSFSESLLQSFPDLKNFIEYED